MVAAFRSAPLAASASITATRPFFAALWRAVLPTCAGARNGPKSDHETCARSSGGGILRACWSRQGRGRGRGWWLLFRTVSFRPTRDPSSARSRRASASSPLSSAATKAGSFWPPWHMMTTEATTTTTKNRLLACTAVGADCRMVHIGSARCRAAPPQCASPAAASARWPGNYWRAGGGGGAPLPMATQKPGSQGTAHAPPPIKLTRSDLPIFSAAPLAILG